MSYFMYILDFSENQHLILFIFNSSRTIEPVCIMLYQQIKGLMTLPYVTLQEIDYCRHTIKKCIHNTSIVGKHQCIFGSIINITNFKNIQYRFNSKSLNVIKNKLFPELFAASNSILSSYLSPNNQRNCEVLKTKTSDM